MASSAEEVFGVYELLEMMLLALDHPIEVIRVKRVCRAWRDIVQDSQRLQQACWYRPQLQPTKTDNEIWRLNPVFQKLGVEVQDPSEIQSFQDPDFQAMLDFPIDPCEWGLPWLRENKRQLGGVYEKLNSPEFGSWGTMLATQPPCRWMIMADWDDDGGWWPFMVYARNPVASGLLMGDVMTVLKEHSYLQQKDPISSIVGLPPTMEFFPVAKDEILAVNFRGMVEEPMDSASITVGFTESDAGDNTYPSRYFSIFRRMHQDKQTARGGERLEYLVMQR